MPILYEITAANGQVSHLLGTPSLEDQKLSLLPIEVQSVLHEAKIAVFQEDYLAPQTDVAFLTRIRQWRETQQATIDEITQCEIEALRIRYNIPPALSTQALSASTKFNTPIGFALDWLLEVYKKRQPHAQQAIEGSTLERQLRRELRTKRIFYLSTALERKALQAGLQFNGEEHFVFLNYMKQKIPLMAADDFASYLSVIDAYLANGIKKFFDPLDLISQWAACDDAPPVLKQWLMAYREEQEISIAKKLQEHLSNGSIFVVVSWKHVIGIVEQLKLAGFTIKEIACSQGVAPISSEEVVDMSNIRPLTLDDSFSLDPSELEVDNLSSNRYGHFQPAVASAHHTASAGMNLTELSWEDSPTARA